MNKQASLRWTLCEVFLRAQRTYLCSKVVPCAAADLVICKSHPGGTGLEAMKSSGGLALWEAIDESAALASVDGSGLKGPCKEVEAWHHEESPWEAIGEA